MQAERIRRARFKAEEDYIKGSFSIDPASFTDDDGKVYVYFGGLWGGQLEKYRTGVFDPDGKELHALRTCGYAPLCGHERRYVIFEKGPVEIEILDENGELLLRMMRNGDILKIRGCINIRESIIFPIPRYDALYCLCHRRQSDGPFTYQGCIMELSYRMDDTSFDYRIWGKWYLFYHDCEYSGGINHRRTVKFTELHYNEDGSIQKIFPYDKSK